MKLYDAKDVNETPELRVTKSTGAILVTFNKALKDLNAERVSIFIEREGGNEELHTNVLLKHLIVSSIAVDGSLKQTTSGADDVSTTALIDLSLNGAIPLGQNESLKIKLTKIYTGITYQLNTLSSPLKASAVFTTAKQNILSDEKERSFNTSNTSYMVVEKWSLTENATFTFSNGARVKLDKFELEALSFDNQPHYGFDSETGLAVNQLGNTMLLPLIGVIQVDFEKQNGAQEITMLTANPIL